MLNENLLYKDKPNSKDIDNKTLSDFANRMREYQDIASDFFGGCSETKGGCLRAAHGFAILRWADGAVELRPGEEQSQWPVVAG